MLALLARISQIVDAGLVLYIGLLLLFVWRFVCYWRCCGRWLEYANYCSLLLVLLAIILIYDTVVFVDAAIQESGRQKWDQLPPWFRPVILSAPFISAATFVFCAVQIFQHVEYIRDEKAVERHDRAVQIILLPVVYGTMAMSSLARMYKLVTQPTVTPQDEELALSRSEACFWVGDLYEAWALYQFGKLTLKLIESTLAKQGLSTTEEERTKARALLTAHSAIESLAWLGILSFLLVCVAQAGWSLFLLTFASPGSKVEAFKSSTSQFGLAGFFASGAAIWNVFVVEQTFHEYLEEYRPTWKFFTVKILVTFAFFQRGACNAAQVIQNTLPTVLQDIAKSIPILGQILTFSLSDFEIFYACLIIAECFLVCILHYWAWHVGEPWYEAEEVGRDGETKALLAGTQTYSYGGGAAAGSRSTPGQGSSQQGGGRRTGGWFWGSSDPADDSGDFAPSAGRNEQSNFGYPPPLPPPASSSQRNNPFAAPGQVGYGRPQGPPR